MTNIKIIQFIDALTFLFCFLFFSLPIILYEDLYLVCSTFSYFFIVVYEQANILNTQISEIFN